MDSNCDEKTCLNTARKCCFSFYNGNVCLHISDYIMENMQILWLQWIVQQQKSWIPLISPVFVQSCCCSIEPDCCQRREVFEHCDSGPSLTGSTSWHFEIKFAWKTNMGCWDEQLQPIGWQGLTVFLPCCNINAIPTIVFSLSLCKCHLLIVEERSGDLLLHGCHLENDSGEHMLDGLQSARFQFASWLTDKV